VNTEDARKTVEDLTKALDDDALDAVCIIYMPRGKTTYHFHATCEPQRNIGFLNAIMSVWERVNGVVLGNLSPEQRAAMEQRDGETMQ
jgi:hypothetical protein